MINIKAVAKSLVVWPWEHKGMSLGSLKDLVVCSTVLSLWRGKGSELGRTLMLKLFSIPGWEGESLKEQYQSN